MTGSDKTAIVFRLRDGRLLGYAEFGNLEGKPVFYFHGYPASRLEGRFLDRVAARHGVRLIAVDRPGMGLSDFKPGRTILDWPDDVVELADTLEIDRFAVEGMSGGGPYSAACAYKIPERLTACGIVGGMGPIDLGTQGMMRRNIVTFFAARRMPWLLRLLLWWSIGRHSRDIENMEKLLLQGSEELPEPDRKIFLDDRLRRLFAEETCEAFRQGAKGLTYEGKLYAKPWGFNLKDISMKVYLWHGELDVNVPISMGRAVAETIPNCQAKFYAQEAHISTALNHLDETIETLTS
mgnify:CR=1 FL=1